MFDNGSNYEIKTNFRVLFLTMKRNSAIIETIKGVVSALRGIVNKPEAPASGHALIDKTFFLV